MKKVCIKDDSEGEKGWSLRAKEEIEGGVTKEDSERRIGVCGLTE